MTREQILSVALDLARTTRYDKITRADIASRAGCATGSINYYFADMDGLRDAILIEARRTNEWRVVAAGLMDGHSATNGLSAPDRALALAAI